MRPPCYDRRSTRCRAHDYTRAGAYFVTIVVEGRRRVFGRVCGGVMYENAAGRMARAWWGAVGGWFPDVVVDDAFVVIPDHVHGIVWLPPWRGASSVVVGAPLVGARRATPPTPRPPHPTRDALTPAGPRRDASAHDPAWRGARAAHADGADVDGAHVDGAHVADAIVWDTMPPHAIAPPATWRAPAIDAIDAGPGTSRVATCHAHARDVARRAPTRGAPTTDDAPRHDAPRHDAPRHAPRPPTLGDVVGAFKSATTHAYAAGVRDAGWPPFPRRLWQRNYHDRIVRDARALAAIRAYIRNNPRDWGAPRA